MRYRFIDAHKKAWPVILMCGVLDVSRSGFCHWRARGPSQRALSNRDLDRRIRKIFDRHKQRYGAPRITTDLHDEGARCSENRVARRMRALGLRRSRRRNSKSRPTQTTRSLSLPICWSRILPLLRPIRNGSAISVISGPTRAGCISRW